VSELDRLIRELIAQEGPINLERFMDLALAHPVHGYYQSKMPLGREGDFVTAPEISQMFGELIGLWVAEVWQMMGAPPQLMLVELGPGRGTLMHDALRALRIVPQLYAGLEVHFVETSPLLQNRQKAMLERSGMACVWHQKIEQLPARPGIFIANEFFDALPVRHYIAKADGWHERLIGLNLSGGLAFGPSPEPEPALQKVMQNSWTPGDILEINLIGLNLMGKLASRITALGGALLVIDYGYEKSSPGETLQALKCHEFVDPLEDIGNADLTTHVDFRRLAEAARAAGSVAHGPVNQGQWLRSLGICERAETLQRGANPRQAEDIRSALTRLIGSEAMGELFKVIAVTSAQMGAPPGFAALREMP
jgi:SAM-dependent MidA family methyltransferase